MTTKATTTLAVCLATLIAAAAATATPPTQLRAFFREGQTFITWKEDNSVKGESYRVYRLAEPITAGNLRHARRLGEVPEGSSRFREMWNRDGKSLLKPEEHEAFMAGRVIPRLVIHPIKQGEKCKMLAEDTGLFVWTARGHQPVNVYYAVTTVAGGKEDRTVGRGNSAGPVEEVNQPIGAVRYYLEPGRGDERQAREWYIMWMDYQLWNPHYLGYAFPFAVTVRDFKQGEHPPPVHLDGIGTMNVFTGDWTNFGLADLAANATNHATWYFGYGRTIRDGQKGADRKDTICNYMQYRLLPGHRAQLPGRFHPRLLPGAALREVHPQLPPLLQLHPGQGLP